MRTVRIETPTPIGPNAIGKKRPKTIRGTPQATRTIDTYTGRGIELPVEPYKAVDDIATLIAGRQIFDFSRGNLNTPVTLGRIMSRIESTLKDPDARLILPTQTTRQFRVQRTKYAGYVAVEDLREIAERYGDARPSYWIGLHWLIQEYSIVQWVYWCSSLYERIRTALYRAVPTIIDHTNVHNDGVVTGNRFEITMGEPEWWYINDRVLKKMFYLTMQLAADLSYDITKWYQLEAAVQDYSIIQYENITKNSRLDRELTPPVTPISGSSPVPNLRARPTDIENMIDTFKNEDNETDDMPSLTFVSSSGVSEGDDDLRIGYHSDQSMEEDSDDVRIIDDSDNDSFDNRHQYPYGERPIIAPSVLRSLMPPLDREQLYITG
ncbi:hypothetical protein M407DRAFT_12743 [Tulasnella calospora MUT 4182]|uniref:Uncharacterized protein n=1 Tax=Tulasnella calospora MUT 4182 TaxID=1051891 RepID=A0A0C3Q2F6_9AGAM|nr:hypothetical protein M407DRAFT_12743 [Tulasnella calospora MUT 4182]